MNLISKNYHILRVKLYRRLMLDWRLANTPVKWLFVSVDSLGIEFFYKGDTVIWLWPWRRKDKRLKFVSVNFSGTGEFGDALFRSLKDLDEAWLDYEKSCAELPDNIDNQPF